MAAIQQKLACSNLLKFKSDIVMEKKRERSRFEHGHCVVAVRCAATLTCFTAELLEFITT